MYKILRAVLFTFDPEKVHSFSMKTLQFICRLPFGKKLIAKLFRPGNKQLATTFLGMQLSNPVGLAAGFDKNASYLNELEALGFGFVEIGTVTPIAQQGNEQPRLFRLPKDKALINRMGFNNEGVQMVKQRLVLWKQKNSGSSKLGQRLIIGGNIGKNKVTPNENAWMDYVTCFNELHPYVDYFVVNVSSPNTPGLRELQEKESLRNILTRLQTANKNFDVQRPILLKIAPDLSTEQIDDVISLALEIQLDGLVAANTTISRTNLTTSNAVLEAIGAGGLSGLPVKQKSTELIEYIHRKTGGKIPLIASGGIFSGADARQKIEAGASLVQVWTGFVYEGPSIVRLICKHLR